MQKQKLCHLLYLYIIQGSRCVAQGCSNSSKNSSGISVHYSPVEQFVEKLTSWLLKIEGSEEPFEVMVDEV